MNKIVTEYYLKKFKFYKEDIISTKSRIYKISNKYTSENWFTNKESIDKDFAKLVKQTLNEIDQDKKSYQDLVFITRLFNYYALKDKNIIIPEITKEKPIFGALFSDCYYEVDDMGSEDCNTNRNQIDLYVELILEPELIFKKFEDINYFNFSLIIISKYIKNDSIRNYLINALKLDYTFEPYYISVVFESIGFQKETIDLSLLKKYLEGTFINQYLELNKHRDAQLLKSAKEELQKNIQRDIVPAILKYIAFTKDDKSLKYLEQMRNKLALEYELDVLSKHLDGEESLLTFFYETKNDEIKTTILTYYYDYYYHSDKFLKLLFSLSLDSNLDYFIKREALSSLCSSSYEKLLCLFGENILNNIDRMNEEINKI